MMFYNACNLVCQKTLKIKHKCLVGCHLSILLRRPWHINESFIKCYRAFYQTSNFSECGARPCQKYTRNRVLGWTWNIISDISFICPGWKSKLVSIFDPKRPSFWRGAVYLKFKLDAQLSRRDRAAGCIIVFAKSRRLELGDNILQTL